MDNQTNQVSYNHFYKHNQLFQKFHEIQWGPGNSRASLKAQVESWWFLIVGV